MNCLRNTFFQLIMYLFYSANGAIHSIKLQDESRTHFPLSTFGFYEGGRMIIDIKKFAISELDLQNNKLGLSLQRTTNDGVSSYMDKISKTCILEKKESDIDMKFVLFVFDLVHDRIIIKKPGKDFNFNLIQITNGTNKKDSWSFNQFSLPYTAITSTRKSSKCENSTSAENILFKRTRDKNKFSFSGQFTVKINCSEQAGLYNLYFHNCLTTSSKPFAVDMEVHMIEYNVGTFLAAGEIPLPIMFGFMSFLFFVAAIIWSIYLRTFRKWTFKIHWLMAIVVYLKGVAVAFHAINFFKTGKEGFHVQTWAILYYIIHLLKGALMFTTIVLIGTGYFFIKHVLSSKEKKLFVIIIPLQVITNVAQIIIDSSEEGNASYQNWSRITIFVDLVCCGAILLPVVWSIRHLTEAAKTDGKAAISLQKLKLFRHFYVMIVCYIYFTRIIVYLIKITVPYQYTWLDEFFTEMGTFLFYVMTGYKFRPANNNPYLNVPQDEPDYTEMNEISPHSAFSENLMRVNKGSNSTV
ncbi:protein GPR107 isoform X1 [Hydra vulgaris]|nr:protein GPR107 [Hydra vulgaris]